MWLPVFVIRIYQSNNNDFSVGELKKREEGFSKTIPHVDLIWRADGRPASVQEAFWDDSHEIPPQVPLEPSCAGSVMVGTWHLLVKEWLSVRLPFLTS